MNLSNSDLILFANLLEQDAKRYESMSNNQAAKLYAENRRALAEKIKHYITYGPSIDKPI